MRREYDLEDILAEFSNYQADAITDDPEPGVTESKTDNPTDAPAPTAEESVHSEEESYAVANDPVFEGEESAPEDDGRTAEELSADEQQLTRVFRAPKAAPGGKKPADTDADEALNVDSSGRSRKGRKKKKESFLARLGLGSLSLIFALVSLLVLAWSLQNLHPDAGSATSASRSASGTNLVSRLDSGLNNAKANALSDITTIAKHYSIPEGETVAPKPNEACYGTADPTDPAQVQQVMDAIQKARDSGLLEGQEVIFSPELSFLTSTGTDTDTSIHYYCDDSILAIAWKELVDGMTLTCCEVKIADGSQIRRKFVDDRFGSSNKLFATSLANSVNSVAAMNADFYMFRDFGIVVYDRELYRFDEATYTGQYKKYNCTDTLFITGEGDFLFWHRLQTATPEEMRAFIADNNIIFSIAFGPVLVENGELQVCDWYPAGEIDKGYSRAGIGQKDHLHYFYMSLNHSAEAAARWTVNQFAERMYARGLQQAYNLDGGQTGELVWQGAPYNHVDFGAEREVSDILYFATAIPESEGTP